MSQIEQVVHSLTYAFDYLKRLCEGNPNLTDCGIVMGKAVQVLNGETVEDLTSVRVLVHSSYWPFLISEHGSPPARNNNVTIPMRQLGLLNIEFFHTFGQFPSSYAEVQDSGRRVEVMGQAFFTTNLYK